MGIRLPGSRGTLEHARGHSLIHPVSGETVWKIGMGPESGLRKGPKWGEETRFGHLLPSKKTVEKPSAIFQTVSED
jgi:hypothetical protein